LTCAIKIYDFTAGALKVAADVDSAQLTPLLQGGYG
jgi:hypothetical protein